MVSFLRLAASILLLCHFGSSPAVDILFSFLVCLLWFLFLSGVLGFSFVRALEGSDLHLFFLVLDR